MARILIVEDEGMLRSAMVKGIQKLPNVVVSDAGTFGAAARAIERQPPDLVIADLDLPDRSGLELLGHIGSRGLRVPILFISAYVKAYGGQIPPHANIEVLEKPVSLETLRAYVVRLTAGQRDRGMFTALDYITIATMGRHSVVITVEDPHPPDDYYHDEYCGEIVIRVGRIEFARDDVGEGVDALARALTMKSEFVTVSCNALTDDYDRELVGVNINLTGETHDCNHDAACPICPLESLQETLLDDSVRSFLPRKSAEVESFDAEFPAWLLSRLRRWAWRDVDPTDETHLGGITRFIGGSGSWRAELAPGFLLVAQACDSGERVKHFFAKESDEIRKMIDDLIIHVADAIATEKRRLDEPDWDSMP